MTDWPTSLLLQEAEIIGENDPPPQPDPGLFNTLYNRGRRPLALIALLALAAWGLFATLATVLAALIRPFLP